MKNEKKENKKKGKRKERKKKRGINGRNQSISFQQVDNREGKQRNYTIWGM
jgi:hypothetical protein